MQNADPVAAENTKRRGIEVLQMGGKEESAE